MAGERKKKQSLGQQLKTLSVLCPVSSFTDPIQLYPDDGSDHGI